MISPSLLEKYEKIEYDENKDSNVPWFKKTLHGANTYEILSCEIVDFAKYAKPKSYEMVPRNIIINKVKLLVIDFFQVSERDFIVVPIGASKANVYSPKDDFEICLYFMNNEKYSDPSVIREFLRDVDGQIRMQNIIKEKKLDFEIQFLGDNLYITDSNKRNTNKINTKLYIQDEKAIIDSIYVNHLLKKYKELYPLLILLRYYFSQSSDHKGDLIPFNSLVYMIVYAIQKNKTEDEVLAKALQFFLNIFRKGIYISNTKGSSSGDESIKIDDPTKPSTQIRFHNKIANLCKAAEDAILNPPMKTTYFGFLAKDNEFKSFDDIDKIRDGFKAAYEEKSCYTPNYQRQSESKDSTSLKRSSTTKGKSQKDDRSNSSISYPRRRANGSLRSKFARSSSGRSDRPPERRETQSHDGRGRSSSIGRPYSRGGRQSRPFSRFGGGFRGDYSRPDKRNYDLPPNRSPPQQRFNSPTLDDRMERDGPPNGYYRPPPPKYDRPSGTGRPDPDRGQPRYYRDNPHVPRHNMR